MQPRGVIGLALFLAGTSCAFSVAARETLADVPWRHLPVALAETSDRLYTSTFIVAAEHYVSFVDAVADIQADSYQTTGEGISVVASALLSLQGRPTPSPMTAPLPLPQTPVLAEEDTLTGFIETAPQRLAAVLPKGAPQRPEPPALSARYIPASGPGVFAPLVRWYREASERVVQRISGASTTGSAYSAQPD